MFLIVLYNLKLWWVFLKPLFEEFKYLIFFYITNSIKDSMGETWIWNTLLNKVQSLFVYLFSFSFFFTSLKSRLILWSLAVRQHSWHSWQWQSVIKVSHRHFQCHPFSWVISIVKTAGAECNCHLKCLQREYITLQFSTKSCGLVWFSLSVEHIK